MNHQRIAIIVVSGLGLLSLFLPWFSAMPLVSFHGVDLLFVNGYPTSVVFVPLLFGCALLLAIFEGNRREQMAQAHRVICMFFGVCMVAFSAHFFAGTGGTGTRGIRSVGVFVVFGASIALLFVSTLGWKWLIVLDSVLVAGLLFVGDVHFVKTDNGTRICTRTSWGGPELFDALIVDEADFIGHPGGTDGVADALVSCGVLSYEHTEPPQDETPQIKTYGVCGTDMNTGMCMDVNDCTTSAGALRGLCPGPDNIVCCLEVKH